MQPRFSQVRRLPLERKVRPPRAYETPSYLPLVIERAMAGQNEFFGPEYRKANRQEHNWQSSEWNAGTVSKMTMHLLGLRRSRVTPTPIEYWSYALPSALNAADWE